jgi:hypothetical protein
MYEFYVFFYVAPRKSHFTLKHSVMKVKNANYHCLVRVVKIDVIIILLYKTKSPK